MKKIALVLLFLAGFLASSSAASVPDVASPQTFPLFDFAYGFFEGINYEGDINKILECIKSEEGILDKIILALNYLIKIDMFHWDYLIKGIAMLTEAFIDFFKLIEPCTRGAIELQKIMELIMFANPIKVAWRLMENAVQFMNDIKDAIKSFTDADFRRAGKDMGGIIYRLYIVDAKLETAYPIFEIPRGILNGLNTGGDLKMFVECDVSIEQAGSNLWRAYLLISTGDKEKVNEGLKLIVTGIVQFGQAIAPCKDGFTEVTKVSERISDVTWNVLVSRVMFNLPRLMELAQSVVTYLVRTDYYNFGVSIGEISYTVLLKA